MEILHTALEVEDIEAVRSFYEELLGLHCTRLFSAGGEQNYYVGGNNGTELQFKVVNEQSEPSGIHHIAIKSDDVDAIVETAVERHQSVIVEEPRTLQRKPIRLAAITDPAGYTVHLLEYQ